MENEEWMSDRVNLVSAIDKTMISQLNADRICCAHRNDRDRPTSEDDDV